MLGSPTELAIKRRQIEKQENKQAYGVLEKPKDPPGWNLQERESILRQNERLEFSVQRTSYLWRKAGRLISPQAGGAERVHRRMRAGLSMHRVPADPTSMQLCAVGDKWTHLWFTTGQSWSLWKGNEPSGQPRTSHHLQGSGEREEAGLVSTARKDGFFYAECRLGARPSILSTLCSW